MGWRGPVGILVLALVGSGLGFAVSTLDRDGPLGSGIANPVAAEGPSLPVDPPSPSVPDPDDPPLEPGIELTTGTLGTGAFMITFPVPAGWRSNTNATNEAKWKQPGTSNNSYVMRVEQITSQDVTIEQAVDTRVVRLRAEQDEVDIEARGADSLEYTYRSNEGNARHSFMRWIDTDADGQADVEVVVHGREVDVSGTSDLITRVAAGLRGS